MRGFLFFIRMKRLLSSIMALLILNVSIFASTPLTRGTSIQVRITSGVSSKINGTSPSAVVENDVKDRNGDVLIKRGTPVQLQVHQKQAKGCGRPGYVNIKCISTTAVDGQYISLEGNIDSEGDDKKGLAVGLGVGLGLTFLPFVGFAFLAIKGEQAKIQSNAIISNVVVLNDYYIAK